MEDKGRDYSSRRFPRSRDGTPYIATSARRRSSSTAPSVCGLGKTSSASARSSILDSGSLSSSPSANHRTHSLLIKYLQRFPGSLSSTQGSWKTLSQIRPYPAVNQHQPSSTVMPGFDFSNYNRNATLHAQGVPLPKATSTGTTIVGCMFDGGVVIAADTRATSGPIVADKVRFKLELAVCLRWLTPASEL